MVQIKRIFDMKTREDLEKALKDTDADAWATADWTNWDIAYAALVAYDKENGND
jgi:hypothetical protein